MHTPRHSEGHGCLWVCLCELETPVEPFCLAPIKQKKYSIPSFHSPGFYTRLLFPEAGGMRLYQPAIGVPPVLSVEG